MTDGQPRPGVKHETCDWTSQTLDSIGVAAVATNGFLARIAAAVERLTPEPAPTQVRPAPDVPDGNPLGVVRTVLAEELGRIEIRTITVRQPWAHLLIERVKCFETRTRPLPPAMLGQRVAIHAGLDLSRWGRPATVTHLRDALGGAALAQVEREEEGIRCWASDPTWGTWRILPVGRVIGWVVFGGCHRVEDLDPTPLERALGDWAPGRWAWEVSEARLVWPWHRARGQLGFWRWTPPEGWVTEEPTVHPPLTDPREESPRG